MIEVRNTFKIDEPGRVSSLDKKWLLLEQLRGGLIVSCQALNDEPLHGADLMGKMAVAAKEGGAIAIRANGGDDIRAVKRATGLPVIGIVKRDYEASEIYITATWREVEEVVQAGADIVALDATARLRPDGSESVSFISELKRRYKDILVMADVSTVEEGVAAAAAGADIVASTMSGYTPYTRPLDGPDFNLLEQLTGRLAVPVIAEGRVRTPEQAVACLNRGVWAVVVGSAITRPQEITRTFVCAIESYVHTPQS